MKKLLLMAGLVSSTFAHMHSEVHGSIMGDIMHIITEPTHIGIVLGIGAVVFGAVKYKKAQTLKEK
jgi:hypothetical protein